MEWKDPIVEEVRKVNYPRPKSRASCFNEGLIGETNELPSPQASIRAIPALLRDILVSLGQVSNSNEFVYRYKTSTKIHPDYFRNWFFMTAFGNRLIYIRHKIGNLM